MVVLSDYSFGNSQQTHKHSGSLSLALFLDDFPRSVEWLTAPKFTSLVDIFPQLHTHWRLPDRLSDVLDLHPPHAKGESLIFSPENLFHPQPSPSPLTLLLFFQLLSPKTLEFSSAPLFLTFYVLPIKKSYWIYLKKLSRIKPLLTSSSAPSHMWTVSVSGLDYRSTPPPHIPPEEPSCLPSMPLCRRLGMQCPG